MNRTYQEQYALYRTGKCNCSVRDIVSLILREKQ